jgi:hypothetical protein
MLLCQLSVSFKQCCCAKLSVSFKQCYCARLSVSFKHCYSARLPVSFIQCSTVIFIFIVLLSEGQAGKAWKLSNITVLFQISESIDQRCAVTLFFLQNIHRRRFIVLGASHTMGLLPAAKLVNCVYNTKISQYSHASLNDGDTFSEMRR